MKQKLVFRATHFQLKLSKIVHSFTYIFIEYRYCVSEDIQTLFLNFRYIANIFKLCIFFYRQHVIIDFMLELVKLFKFVIETLEGLGNSLKLIFDDCDFRYYSFFFLLNLLSLYSEKMIPICYPPLCIPILI